MSHQDLSRNALLVLEEDDNANRLHIDFKNKVISRLDGDTFSLSEEDVRQAAAELESQRGKGRKCRTRSGSGPAPLQAQTASLQPNTTAQ